VLPTDIWIEQGCHLVGAEEANAINQSRTSAFFGAFSQSGLTSTFMGPNLPTLDLSSKRPHQIN
jgi:hypothetical protein